MPSADAPVPDGAGSPVWPPPPGTRLDERAARGILRSVLGWDDTRIGYAIRAGRPYDIGTTVAPVSMLRAACLLYDGTDRGGWRVRTDDAGEPLVFADEDAAWRFVLGGLLGERPAPPPRHPSDRVRQAARRRAAAAATR